MSDTTTPNYGFTLPSIGASQDTWGNKLNANWTEADAVIHALASGYLPIYGGTLSGSLTIAPGSGYAFLTLSKPAGANGNQIEGATAGTARWTMHLGTAEAEGGGNTGSNFGILRYDDGGNFLGEPLGINRATGNVSIAQALSVAGNVAIAQALSVAGVLSANNGITSNYIHSTGGFMADGGMFYVANNTNYYLGRSGSDGSWRFVENGQTNATIDTSGNVIARAGVFGSAVQSSGAVFARSGRTYMGAAGSGVVMQFDPSWYWDWNSTNGNIGLQTAFGLFWFFRINPDAMAYNNLGPVGGIGPYVNNSDARGKEDIADATPGLAEILRLRPVTFKRKPKVKTLTPRTELGFIAQELREVIPEAVSVVGIELPDGSGGIDSADPTLATTLDPIVATLVNAVKEMAARLAALEVQRRA